MYEAHFPSEIDGQFRRAAAGSGSGRWGSGWAREERA